MSFVFEPTELSMGHPQSWQEHFKESLGHLSASASLVEAIAEGHLSEANYLTWACENYQQPVLDVLFFSSPRAPQKDVWLKWKDAFTWSSTCLPIGEWDGHLIIGSLEPLDLPAELSGLYVFSPAAPLQELWNQWSQVNNSSAVGDQSMPEGLELKDTPDDSPSDLSELSEHQNLTGENETNLESESQMPEGLSPSLTPPASLLSRIPQTPLTQNEPPEFRDSQIISVPQSVGPVKLETVTPSAPLKTAKSDPSAETMPAHNIIAQPKMTSVLPSEQSWLELVQTKGTDLFGKLCSELFIEMKAYFDHTILLSYNEASKNVLAMVWDVDLNESSSKIYSLETPSVLRIVRNTEKPYHGSPVINDFNEKFFEDWHSGELPDHLTITPLIVEGKVIGMVYASGRNAANTPQALSFAETQTKEFLKQILAKLANQAA